MDSLTIAAASGMRALMDTLNMSANNLANSSTNGFKSDKESYNLYVSPDAQAAADGEGYLATTVPVVQTQWTDFAQGLLIRTGNQLDLALNGKGFFAANGPSGPLYTRNGSFKINPQGILVTHEGYPVRTVDKTPPIQTQSLSPLEVTPEGEVLQDGQTLGTLEIVNFPDTHVLAKQGNNYFNLTDPNAKPAPVTETQVEQGKVEGSNSSSANAAVRLVSVMRQFEMLQKAVSISGDMNKHAVEEVARIGS
jgi:flagellar basal-body rod protein FlgF